MCSDGTLDMYDAVLQFLQDAMKPWRYGSHIFAERSDGLFVRGVFFSSVVYRF